MDQHELSDESTSHALSSITHAAFFALAAFGLVVAIMIVMNAKEPYGGPLEA